MARHQWGNKILCYAARLGCLPFNQQLFALGANNAPLRQELLTGSPKHHDEHQSIGEAAAAGHVDVVRFLLAQDGIGGHLLYVDGCGNSVLHKAAAPAACHPGIFDLLLDKMSTSAFQLNDADKMPLDVLIDTHSDQNSWVLECARAMIRKCNMSVSGTHKRREHLPLVRAALNCDVAMCLVLLQEGDADLHDIFKYHGNSVKFIDEAELVRKAGEKRVQEMFKAICEYNK